MTGSIALVTCARFAAGEDAHLLDPALSALGMRLSSQVWDGPAAALHDAGRAVMAQPYLADIDTAGQTSLIYLDGAFSHAVRKAPMLPEATVHDVTPDGSAGRFRHDQNCAARFAAAVSHRL